jgi:DNA invertase Pin-like site-specific DNA recombinase
MNAARIRERLNKNRKTATDGKVYSYLRFSTPEQSEGDSERRQIDKARAWAKRNGHTLDDALRISDLGLSGYKGDHRKKGALGRFLQAAEEGKVPAGSILVVENIDRLSREGVGQALRTTIFRLFDCGVIIQTLSPEETYEPGCEDQPKFIALLLYLSRAREEIGRKSEMIADSWAAWRERAAKGEKSPPPGTMPCWVEWVPDESVSQPDRLSRQTGKFVLVEEAAAAIRQIFRWAAEGIGVHTITKRLNGAGVKPIGRLAAWRVCTVGALLARRDVLGEFEDLHGKIYPKFYPAVIKESLWYRVRAAMSTRKIGKKGMGRTAEGAANLFMGIVHNAEDGAPLYLVKKQRDYTYLVNSAALRGDPGSRSLGIPYDAFEGGILDAIDELTPADILGGDEGKDDEVHELDGRIKELESHLRKAEAKIDRGGDVDAILDLMQKWEGELKEKKAELETLRARAAFDPTDALDVCLELRRKLRSVEGEERTELRERLKSRLRTLIDAIWTLPYDVDGNTRALVAHVVLRSGRIRLVNLCWLRRGKRSGYCFGTSQTLAIPGHDANLEGKLLSAYRTDAATREWTDGHLERMRPALLKVMAEELKYLEENIIPEAVATAEKKRQEALAELAHRMAAAERREREAEEYLDRECPRWRSRRAHEKAKLARAEKAAAERERRDAEEYLKRERQATGTR